MLREKKMKKKITKWNDIPIKPIGYDVCMGTVKYHTLDFSEELIFLKIWNTWFMLHIACL